MTSPSTRSSRVRPPHGTGQYLPLIDDAKYPNIGDRLTAKGISWNWYSGGWDDAEAGHPGALFQYHHQPFNYFANYAPGKPGRAHLQDETKFIASAKNGSLPAVSFVKPYGAENEHPGYASESNGSDHLVDLLKTIRSGPEAKDTLVVVTYDEFGGQWDHVSPPKIDALGTGHPDPGAGHRWTAAHLRRRPHGLRHHLDHGHDRAQLPPEAGLEPGRPGERPVRGRVGAQALTTRRSTRPEGAYSPGS